MRLAWSSHRDRPRPPLTGRSHLPLIAAVLGTVVSAGAVLAGAVLAGGPGSEGEVAPPSTPGIHRIAFTVPADITDGGGSGGCQPGAPCTRSPGMPMTPGGSSSGGSSSGGFTGSDTTNTAPALPVPGSDPAEIESHQAKPDVGGGASPALTPPPSAADPSATPDGSQVPVPVTTPSGAKAAGGGATSGGASPGGTTGGGENVSPNQAMDLVATILGAVSKLISGLFG